MMPSSIVSLSPPLSLPASIPLLSSNPICPSRVAYLGPNPACGHLSPPNDPTTWEGPGKGLDNLRAPRPSRPHRAGGKCEERVSVRRLSVDGNDNTMPIAVLSPSVSTVADPAHDDSASPFFSRPPCWPYPASLPLSATCASLSARLLGALSTLSRLKGPRTPSSSAPSPPLVSSSSA